MKIAIVGGGWIGCHLASKLRNKNEITLFEKEGNLFTQTSYNNQNRLHIGYHYARSYRTRKLCTDTFDRFMEEYGQFTTEVANNYYCVSNDSCIDYETFLQIFKEYDIEAVNNPLDGIEGTVNTKERHINFIACNEYFNKTLHNVVVNREILSCNEIKNDYDLVINCTNNHLNHNVNSYFEITITMIYEKLKPTPFDAITLIDGPFFSIFPYTKNKYTLTDVEHTPIKKVTSLKKLKEFVITNSIIEAKRKIMEKKVMSYFPKFKEHFKYDNYYLSIKSKREQEKTGDRYPQIIITDNIVSCYTGKIQGIFVIEDYFDKLLK